MNRALSILCVHQQHPLAAELVALDCQVISVDQQSEMGIILSEHIIDLILVDPACLTPSVIAQLQELKRADAEYRLPVLLILDSNQDKKNEMDSEVIDDCLVYPLAPQRLQQRLAFLQRMLHTQRDFQQQQKALSHYRHLIETEQHIAHNIFDNIIRTGAINLPNIRFTLSPLSTFNGDVLLMTRTPDELVHIILGDFTGHGLPAAIGTLPMSEVFYSMTAKNLPAEEIILEINKKLKALLPSHIFCAAMFLEINEKRMELRYWNGGLPDGLMVRAKHGIFESLASNHLPLGINPSEQIDATMKVLPIKEEDRIFLYTDGLIEAKNTEDVAFSGQRLRDVVDDVSIEPGKIYEVIQEKLRLFSDQQQQCDDMTLLEYKVNSR